MQGYIETQNPALRSLVLGRKTPGKDSTKMFYGGGNSRPAERYATFSEVYGPYREDSMELKEETAYQRGMMEHIRENMSSINKLNAELSDSTFPPRYSQQWKEIPTSPASPPGEPFYPQRMDASERTHHEDFQGNMASNPRAYSDQYLLDGFPGSFKPKPTYTELAQTSSSKLPPPLTRTYTEMFLEPKTHSTMENGKKTPSHEVVYLQKSPRSTKFGMSSLPLNGWKTNTLSQHEEFWDQRSHGLGKFTDRNGNDRSLDFNTSSRIPHMPGNHTLPLTTVRLPALGNAQSLPSLHTFDRYQGNAANPGKLNIDINLKMLSHRDDDDDYGQYKYHGSETWHGNSYNNTVPPMALNNSLTPLGHRPPVLCNSQSSVPPPQYQPFSSRNNGQVDQQIVEATQGSTIYPYRQMNNPWFPPLDELPAVRKNMRRGKYGHYRVFDIHDYKKLQKELRLGSLVGEQRDVETIQEKKEKRAILQEYGRLVRAKNREEMRPPLPL